MIFETLAASAERGELLLWQNALCHYHLRRDGQLTVREVIVLPHYRRQGIARRMIAVLDQSYTPRCMLARCPADLPANTFWAALGFELTAIERSRTGREIHVWRLR